MKKNENGYALVLVLLIISIVFTFALTMSTMAFSARKQIDKTDQVNRATDLAEMGVAHYEAMLSRFVAAANAHAEKTISAATSPIPDYDELFRQHLTASITTSTNFHVPIEGRNSYKVTDIGLPTSLNPSQMMVSFKSEGDTGTEQKVLTSSITIKKKDSGPALIGTTPPLSASYGIIINTPLSVNKAAYFEKSTYFSREITLNGGNKKPFIINGNAFFNDSFTIHGSARIEVRGDAIFRRKLTETEKSYSFCITGTAYWIDQNGKLTVYHDFPAGRADTCVKKSNGSWTIDPYNDIKVEY